MVTLYEELQGRVAYALKLERIILEIIKLFIVMSVYPDGLYICR